MEVSPHAVPAAKNWTEQFSVALHNQRQRVHEFLCAQQDRLRRAEAGLNAQLQQITSELAEDQNKTRRTEEELVRRAEQLRNQSAELEQIKAEVAARQAEWEKLSCRVLEQEQSFTAQFKQQQEELALKRQEILEQQSAALAAGTQLQSEKKAIETDRKAIEADRAELENHRAKLQAWQDTRDSRQSALEKQQQELEKQQRNLEKQQQEQDLQQLESDKGRQELEKRQRNLDNRQQEQDLQQLELEQDRQEIEKQQRDLEKQKQEQEIQRRELDKQQEELAQQTAEIESRRRRIARELKARHTAYLNELQQQRQELEQAKAANNCELQEELESLREQCRILRSNPPPAVEAAPHREDEEQKEKYLLLYESANQELNDLKSRYNELQQEMSRLSQGGRVSMAQISGGTLNWEAEKKRVLAALEADHDDDSEEHQEEKLNIESVIRKTDGVVADKDREIAELRELLASQTKQIGSVAVGAAAVGQILDNDPFVQEERKNLKKLQNECSEKLRKAEVEIAIERAKLARERSQLEDKIRILEHQGINLRDELEAKGPAKPVRGRWLSRMGLNDPEEGQNKP